MAEEIERKFLVKEIPGNLSEYSHQEIVQGYLTVDDEMEIRLRKKGNRFYQAIKQGKGLTRNETEIELSLEQFEQLWPCSEGRRVRKLRYRISYNQSIIELDIFQGELSNLILAEVEFKSKAESEAFVLPFWFGKEVTSDERFKNKNLAINGIPCLDEKC